MKITIVLPSYNEVSKISNLLEDLSKQNYPIVVVDDGSTDGTSRKIEIACKNNRRLTLLKHKVNLGKGEALKTGCNFAFEKGAQAVIIMDSDGQHEVSDIKNIANKLISGKYHLVFGTRIFKGDIPLERFLYNKFSSIVVNVFFGKYISDVLCGFRGFTAVAYKKVKWNSSGYSIDAEMAVRAIKRNLTFCEVDVATVYYDKYKGVSIKESIEIFMHLIYWKIFGI